MLLAGDIDMGHARALLAIDAARQIILANEIITKRMSVRDAEKLVGKTIREGEEPVSKKNTTDRKDGDTKRLEEALSDQMGTKVSLKINRNSTGQLIIDFHDWEHLNALLERQGLGGVIDQ